MLPQAYIYKNPLGKKIELLNSYAFRLKANKQMIESELFSYFQDMMVYK